MSNVTSKKTGIENVVLWVGPNPESNILRIKVSNVPNKFDGLDCFTLTLPDYKIIGKIDSKFITKKILGKIKHWCEKNMEAIIEYSEHEISTDDLFEKIIKI
jgi:glutamate 5-kinase